MKCKTPQEQLRWLSQAESINPGTYLYFVADYIDKLEATLKWYEERLHHFEEKNRTPDYLEAVATELSLDGGKRIREILSR